MLKEILENQEINEGKKFGKSIKSITKDYLGNLVEYSETFTQEIEDFLNNGDELVKMYAKENKLDLNDEEVEYTIHSDILEEVSKCVDEVIRSI